MNAMEAHNPESFLKTYKSHAQRALLLSFGFNYLGGLLLIAQAWFLTQIIYSAAFAGLGFHALSHHVYALGGVFIARFLLGCFSGYQASRAAVTIKQHLRDIFYRKIFNNGPLYVSKAGSGALVGTLSDGIEATGKYYQDYIPAKAMMSALPLSLLVLVFPLDTIAGLTMMLTAPFIPLFMVLIGKGAESMNQKQWKHLARMGTHFLDAVQGLTTLKIFGAAQREAAAIAKTADRYRRDTMSVLRLAFLSSVTLEFFSTISIALVAVFIGFRLMWGEMDFISGFFILLLAPEFYLPLRQMGKAYHARMESIGAAETMIALMDAPVMETGGQAPAPSSAQATSLQFDNVSCCYHGAEALALHDVSFDLQPGQMLALTGPSGSGKSTILNLILGFLPASEGQILVNGLPLSDLDMAAWRAQLAWIPQKPTLFHGSVLENMALGNADASEEEIKTLCSFLGLDDFINGLPQGYNTLVGERGYGLSGGQIQRLAIARAFLRKDAALIIMDEPTASLDFETEQLLQAALSRHAAGKSIITIAHRLQTITQADQILFMDSGTIIERGTHAELMQRNAAYAELTRYAFLERSQQEDAA